MSHAEHTKQQIIKEQRNTKQSKFQNKSQRKFFRSSQIDKNVTSKKTPVTGNIDFCIDKLVPTIDIPDSEHHVLLPFFDDMKKYQQKNITL